MGGDLRCNVVARMIEGQLVPMPLNIGWWEIAVRLALTVAARIWIGTNRSEHGHSAGLRTTLLVCLAASLSMLQVNLLLPMTGKTSSSFAVMDLMRLPLGILSGMGFIGAGAIVRKDGKSSHRGSAHDFLVFCNRWLLAPGSWLLAPGSWLLAPGSWLLAPGSCSTEKHDDAL